MSSMEMFGTFTTDAADKAHRDLSSGAFFKTGDGGNHLRIVPPLPGQTLPWVEVYQHFIKFPGADRPVVFNCPKKMANSPCPACDKAEQLAESANLNDQKNAKEFEASFRAFCYVVNRREPEKGIQPWAFGVSIKKRLIEFRRNADLGGGEFTHHETGKDIIVTKSGTGMKTTYQTDLGAQCPLSETTDQLMDWLDVLPEDGLKGFTKILPLATIVAKLQEASGGATAQATPGALPSASIESAMGQTTQGGGSGPAW